MVKLKYEISDTAMQDIVHALIESQRNFGEIARTRYRKLIERAIEDICNNPNRPGSRTRDELGSWKTYHIAFSKHQAPHKKAVVKKPRHLLVYKQIDHETLFIVRVLHDALELSQHIPLDTELE